MLKSSFSWTLVKIVNLNKGLNHHKVVNIAKIRLVEDERSECFGGLGILSPSCRDTRSI